MSQVIRVAVSAAGAGWESELLAEIDRSDRIQLVRRCVDIADLLATSTTHRLDAALVSLNSTGFDTSVVERLASNGVRVGTVESDGGHLGLGGPVRLGELGAWLAETADPVVGATESESGKVVAVWGPTGAPGRTSLAISLATAAAAANLSTAIVDADVNGGAVGQWLGILDDVSGLMAACRDVTRGTQVSVERHLLSLDDRTNVLTGVPRPDMWHNLRPGAIEGVLQQISTSHELVVVDCAFSAEASAGPTAGQITRRILEVSDEVVVVGRVDPIGLARLVRCIEDLGPWPRAPRLVLNSFRASLGWSEAEVSSTITELTGIVPWAFLPFDGPSHDLALMRGQPLRQVAPSSGYVARVERLVAGLGFSRQVDRAVSR